MAVYPQGMPPRPLEGYPAYGAVHDVAPGRVKDFLYDFGRIADGVFARELPPVEVNPIPDFVPQGEFDDSLIILDGLPDQSTDERMELQIIDPETRVPRTIDVSHDYDSRIFYRVFDPESLGVSVVEMDPSKRQAQAVRAIWEKKDFGVVENEARSEMCRRLPITVPHLRFNRVEGVGRRMANYPSSDIRQKLALMPDTNYFTETFDLIENEADIIVAAIKQRLKQFIYPWDVNPHLTFAVFRPHAQPDDVVRVKEMANDYLAKNPITVKLGALAFRSKLHRSKRH